MYGDRHLGVVPRNTSPAVRTDAAAQAAHFGHFLAKGASDPFGIDQNEFLTNSRGPPDVTCGPATRARASWLLSMMDVVGVREHLSEFMWLVAARLRARTRSAERLPPARPALKAIRADVEFVLFT